MKKKHLCMIAVLGILVVSSFGQNNIVSEIVAPSVKAADDWDNSVISDEEEERYAEQTLPKGDTWVDSHGNTHVVQKGAEETYEEHLKLIEQGGSAELPKGTYGNGKAETPSTGSANGTVDNQTKVTPTKDSYTKNNDGTIKNNTDHILIVIDGKVITTDVYPQVVNGRVLVPIRVISENLGAKVDYNKDSKAFTITSKDQQSVIKGQVGKSTVTVNGQEKQIDASKDVVVTVTKNRTMCPLRFVSENLGADVNYKDRVVYVTTK